MQPVPRGQTAFLTAEYHTFFSGDVYSRVMIDLPLVYEDTASLGYEEAIQCCIPCCAKEGRGLCQVQGWKIEVCLWEGFLFNH